MKLLIITQSVDKNDQNLGAFYRWWEKMAEKVESMTIICSRKGEVDLPPHVMVESLGKERGVGKMRRIWKFWELFSWHYARSDAVLFHQIPEFVVAASPFLISLKKRTVLWYAHKSVSPALTIAERLVDWVATSSPEGFRMRSKKVVYTGQAIDTEFFTPRGNPKQEAGIIRFITIGRISPVKNYELIIEACAIGKRTWPWQWHLTVVGGPLTDTDRAYEKKIKDMVVSRGLSSHIEFVGPRPYRGIPDLLRAQDVFVNMSATGSLDKAVLEAMSCGLSVITSNEAYREILPERYFLRNNTSAEELSRRMEVIAGDPRPVSTLREIVVNKHGLDSTIEKIMGCFTIPMSRSSATSSPSHVRCP